MLPDLNYQWASSLLGFIALAMTPFRKFTVSIAVISRIPVPWAGSANWNMRSDPVLQVRQAAPWQLAVRAGVVGIPIDSVASMCRQWLRHAVRYIPVP